MTENYIKLLENQLLELDRYEKGGGNVISKQQLIGWCGATKGVLERIFGKHSQKLVEIESLNYRQYSSGAVDKNGFIDAGKLMINTWIKELEVLGTPISIDSTGDNMSLTIVQNQNQVVQLSVVLECVKDELTGAQQKELQAILDDPDVPKESKRKKIFDKIKSFGSDVASNIVANILTNPGMYGG